MRQNTFGEECRRFDAENHKRESALLTFHGVQGWDVYNCSIPFPWHGKEYIYGRVEKRAEWARSWVRLFQKTGPDEYTLVPEAPALQLEAPFISVIGGKLVLGGTHVRYSRGKIHSFYDYFYEGDDPANLYYTTTGPKGMKDIRLVELANGETGVFSRPRGAHVRKRHGLVAYVGFTTVKGLADVTPAVVNNAPMVQGLFAPGEWGGRNQCYLLQNGHIGVVGHKSYSYTPPGGVEQKVYTNISFQLNPATLLVYNQRLLATRASFPAAPAKRPNLAQCAFASGIVPRADGRWDLYSGLGDTAQGRTVIAYPFDSPCAGV